MLSRQLTCARACNHAVGHAPSCLSQPYKRAQLEERRRRAANPSTPCRRGARHARERRPERTEVVPQAGPSRRVKPSGQGRSAGAQAGR